MSTVADILQGQPLVIASKDALRSEMTAAYHAAAQMLEEGGCELRMKAIDGRTAEQNARMWAMLGDVAKQVDWHGTRLTAEEWKDVFTASLKRQKAVPGLDGGFVVVGGRTSRMSKLMHSDLMEVIASFGSQHRVIWTDPKWLAYLEDARAAA